jgi:hypothetical protein
MIYRRFIYLFLFIVLMLERIVHLPILVPPFYLLGVRTPFGSCVTSIKEFHRQRSECEWVAFWNEMLIESGQKYLCGCPWLPTKLNIHNIVSGKLAWK